MESKAKTQKQRIADLEELLLLTAANLKSIKARLAVLERAALIELFGGRHSIAPDIHKVLSMGISGEVLAELSGTSFQGNYLDSSRGPIETAEEIIQRIIDRTKTGGTKDGKSHGH